MPASRPKHLPDSGPFTVEITARCFQRRYLMRPDPLTNDRIRGVVAYATQCHPEVGLHLITFQSNHYHAILTVPEKDSLLDFVALLQSRLAYETNLVRGRAGKFWHRPCASFVIPPTQLEARLRNLLAQGIPSGLYTDPRHNPCVDSLGALTKGTPLTGGWIDRTAFHAAGGHQAGNSLADFTCQLNVRFVPPPGWEHLRLAQQQARWRALAREACAEATQKRLDRGVHRIRGASWVCALDPLSRPEDGEPERRPRSPMFGDPEAEAASKAETKAAHTRRQVSLERLAARWSELGYPASMYPPAVLRPLLRRRE